MKKEHDICKGCVYYPPNLPESLYTVEDWALLQGKECSFDAAPGSSFCNTMRKGECSLVKLDKTHD